MDGALVEEGDVLADHPLFEMPFFALLPNEGVGQPLGVIRLGVVLAQVRPPPFSQANGKPLDPNNLVKREFKRALRRAGLRDISFHSLRHSFTALLIEADQNPKYIQTQLGHASIKTTMDRYGHLVRGENPEASKRLQAVFLEENGSKVVADEAVGR